MLLRELKRLVERLVGEAEEKRREKCPLVLTLIAALRLRLKGKPLTPGNIAREAREVIERSGMDWGVKSEEYTEAMATSLLNELVEMGVLEPDPDTITRLGKAYRFRGAEDASRDEVAKAVLEAVSPCLLRAV